jgi:hypothetical protein
MYIHLYYELYIPVQHRNGSLQKVHDRYYSAYGAGIILIANKFIIPIIIKQKSPFKALIVSEENWSMSNKVHKIR